MSRAGRDFADYTFVFGAVEWEGGLIYFSSTVCRWEGEPVITWIHAMLMHVSLFLPEQIDTATQRKNQQEININTVHNTLAVG